MTAIRNGFKDVVEELLKAPNLKIFKKNDNNEDALDVANASDLQENVKKDIIELLEKYIKSKDDKPLASTIALSAENVGALMSERRAQQ
jgi:hypothetical protein